MSIPSEHQFYHWAVRGLAAPLKWLESLADGKVDPAEQDIQDIEHCATRLMALADQLRGKKSERPAPTAEYL